METIFIGTINGLFGGLLGSAIGRRFGRAKLGFGIGFVVEGALTAWSVHGPGSRVTSLISWAVFFGSLIVVWAWIGGTVGRVQGNAARGRSTGLAIGITSIVVAFAGRWIGLYVLTGIAVCAPLVIGWVVLFGVVGEKIGRPKGREAFGFWMGFWFGVIGWIVAAVVQPTNEARATQIIAVNEAVAAATGDDLRPCPLCAELIRQAAVLCRYCGNEIAPAT